MSIPKNYNCERCGKYTSNGDVKNIKLRAAQKKFLTMQLIPTKKKLIAIAPMQSYYR